MTLPTKRSSDQIATLGLSKEQTAEILQADSVQSVIDARRGIADAGSKSALFRQASAPSNPTGDYALRLGDSWTSTDTTTNCADLNCTGRARNTDGTYTVALGTAAPHANAFWGHLWDGSAWKDSERKIVANEILADRIAANALKTTNYASSGTGSSEVATAGAKMQNDASGLALIVGPQGAKFGSYFIDEIQQTLLKGLARITSGSGSSLSVDRVWYRGNDSPSYQNGAPYIGAFAIKAWWENAVSHLYLEGYLVPSALSDNLDAMRFVRFDLYRQSAAGTTGTLTSFATRYVPVTDRLYFSATDSNAGNQCIFSHPVISSAITAGGFPAAKVTLYNAHGPSDTHCLYSAAGWANGSFLTDNGTSFPAGLTGGGSGGTGGGGGLGAGCLDPDSLIMLMPGFFAPLHSVREGQMLWTMPENGGAFGMHRVESVRHTRNLRNRVTLRDGRSFVSSVNHRMNVRGVWRRVDSLQPGEELSGNPSGIIKGVEYLGEGPVVQLSIPTARTYFAGAGMWHHNTLKP
jgi:hypothetical protein